MAFVEPPRATEMRELSRRTYAEYSALPSLVTLKDSPTITEGEFLKFASRVSVGHEWFTDPSMVPNALFYDLARSIGLSERAYLVKEMRGLSGVTHRTGINPQVLEEVVHDMTGNGLTPTAILLPIDIYQEVYSNWDRTGRMIRYGAKESLTLGGAEMRLYWSNKFNQFDECLVVCRKFAVWEAKPSVRERLQVVFENDGTQITGVLMQTLFRFRPIEARGVTIVGKEPPPTVSEGP